ncbi:hypothetical protein SCHPADRAFT_568724 [Schizopora paradoxa]|uniref:Uncharacterized protein n=1 Tax=Schizopora paradoxa TaxID=27342 RepID=A0A0H2RCW3_9AGAM|nr:hypothetical protein SCHPADRAFT_568724 [Schizopora paradoxa]
MSRIRDEERQREGDKEDGSKYMKNAHRKNSPDRMHLLRTCKIEVKHSLLKLLVRSRQRVFHHDAFDSHRTSIARRSISIDVQTPASRMSTRSRSSFLGSYRLLVTS